MPIRWRTTALAAGVLGVLLACCGWLFVNSLTTQLEGNLDEVLAARASALAGRIEPDGSIDPTTSAALAPAGPAQVLTPEGKVVYPATTGRAAAPAPLLAAAPLSSASADGSYIDDTTSATARAQETGRLRVLALAVPTVQRVVVVAESPDGVEDTVEAARTRFVVVGLAILGAATLGAWMITGAALARVERLRAQAQALSAGDGSARLEIPPGHDEITRLATTFDELLARLDRSIARERAFVADAGHELRTPLTVLRGELELAARPGADEADLRRAITVAGEEADRLAALADDLLVLSREGGPETMAPLDLTEVVRGAVDRVRPLADEAGIELVCRVPALVVHGDASRLDRAVTNGVVNAIRHAHGAHAITVTAAEDDDKDGATTTIEIADDGPGFPPEFLPRAFDRFSRATAVRGRTDGGTGLGLAIVAAIMAAHGGTATASNRHSGQGAVLTLSWPSDGPRPGPRGAAASR